MILEQGERWKVGCADGLEVMRKMKDRSIPSIITSPPEAEKDVPREFLAQVILECLRVSSGPVVWVGPAYADGRYPHEFDEAIEPHQIYHWAVTNYRAEFYGVQPIYCWRVGYKRPFKHGLVFGPVGDETKITGHPGAMPFIFAAQIVRAFGGLIVFDPFMGTGIMGVAALVEGKKFLGIDIDERWVTYARGALQSAEREGAVCA